MLRDAEKQSKFLNGKGVFCSRLKSLLIFEFQDAGWVMILSVWGLVFFHITVSFKEKFLVSNDC